MESRDRKPALANMARLTNESAKRVWRWGWMPSQLRLVPPEEKLFLLTSPFIELAGAAVRLGPQHEIEL